MRVLYVILQDPGSGSPAQGKDGFAGGANGFPAALAVPEETAEYLGAGLPDLISLFQPERVLRDGWAGFQDPQSPHLARRTAVADRTPR